MPSQNGYRVRSHHPRLHRQRSLTRRAQTTQYPPPASAPPEPAPQSQSLSGTITDELGNPVPNVSVILHGGLATRPRGQSATTDAHRWDWHTGLRLEHPTHVSADAHDWWDLTIPGAPGASVTKDFTLTRGGALTGRITTARGRFPFRDFDLRIIPADEGRSGTAYATTAHNGTFTTRALFPGTYIVQWNEPMADYPELGRVTIEPGKTADLSVALMVSVTVEPAQ